MRKTLLTAAFVMSGGAVMAQDTGPSKTDPQVAFNNNCRQCHSTDEGDHRLGPSLYEIVGKEAGVQEGYQYSSALESADHTWDEDMLDQWIENPDQVVSGHKMKPYPGQDDPEIRAAIIEHLGGGSGEDAEGSEEQS
ncbi:cytochrome C class I [Roseivivax marinus]|jgi:cytochrome c|uniref:Cytochrome C class I n=1 Tax=Roseivivax marinus TaxID=1379903 RepID=W4HGV8_9RHOB|nr:c-type cytochrome [Roseivivax marinus]ETW11643.1 cytochrome C class I [Roseivivax marinus]